MSQSQKQIIHCPVCGKPLLKISGAEVGCEVDIICPHCEKEEKINCRLTQEGWERYKKYEK